MEEEGKTGWKKIVPRVRMILRSYLCGSIVDLVVPKDIMVISYDC